MLYPTKVELMSLTERDYGILMPPPSKADQFGMIWGNNPIWLPFSGTAALNAARALAAWEMRAMVAPEKRSSTPLFCGPEGTGSALRSDTLKDTFHCLLAYSSNAETAKLHSVHSFRSYLASAMMAADCSDAQIQAALRWAADDALKCYKVANKEAYGGWLIRAEKVKLTGERAISLRTTHRHLPTTGHEEMVAHFIAGRNQLDSSADCLSRRRRPGCRRGRGGQRIRCPQPGCSGHNLTQHFQWTTAQPRAAVPQYMHTAYSAACKHVATDGQRPLQATCSANTNTTPIVVHNNVHIRTG